MRVSSIEKSINKYAYQYSTLQSQYRREYWFFTLLSCHLWLRHGSRWGCPWRTPFTFFDDQLFFITIFVLKNYEKISKSIWKVCFSDDGKLHLASNIQIFPSEDCPNPTLWFGFLALACWPKVCASLFSKFVIPFCGSPVQLVSQHHSVTSIQICLETYLTDIYFERWGVK